MQYLGADVSSELISDFLHVLSEVAGAARASLLRETKARRDGMDCFHLTLLTPKEFSAMRVDFPFDDAPVSFLGLGRLVEAAEVFFVVAQSDRIVEWRANLGLPDHDLHITLGFFPHDLHNIRKGPEVIMWPARAARATRTASVIDETARDDSTARPADGRR